MFGVLQVAVQQAEPLVGLGRSLAQFVVEPVERGLLLTVTGLDLLPQRCHGLVDALFEEFAQGGLLLAEAGFYAADPGGSLAFLLAKQDLADLCHVLFVGGGAADASESDFIPHFF